jgi:hypothetical protein
VANPEETDTLTDTDLAYAWLYQDVAHGDASRTGLFPVVERYRAAVSVFSHIAVVALETLHYSNHLVDECVIDLPMGTFFEKVIVPDSEYSMIGKLIMTPVGDDLTNSAILGSVPEELMPAVELAQKSVQIRVGNPESEVITLKTRASPAEDA